MSFKIVAVGQKLPDWVETGVNEYIRRMPPEALTVVVPVRAEKRSPSRTTQQVVAMEGKRILSVTSPRDYLLVLDERGERITTHQLAQALEGFLREGQEVVFVIGGADGLDASVKEKAKKIWRLSDLTLPHALVRVVLAEQLYRAMSLLKKHPYHRE
ncbi:MAG: 23S rRNA (pseudouridine(1915)-N(3))-methyltransferase RlmH [Proteobacteria bacterium]|nr:23S rRNA (pseudouridine(1915)-N(3))-methyltransferase RlmH [Pseudomonadota bacterium]MDE3208172.1 23S rRNA (pseudouridine(1915)-N(3))-methyltransferase RlmH [Pseudomonadota bacterium]